MNFLIAWLCWPWYALAATEDGSKPAAAPPPFGGQVVLDTLIGLALILVLILALGWVFKHLAKRPLGAKGMINVLGGVSLGPRERAVLVEVGATRLLLGVAPGRVQMLHVLPGAETNEFQDRLDQQLKDID